MKYKETPFGRIPEDWNVQPINEITSLVTDYVANGSFASLAENVKYKDEKDVAVLIRLVDYNRNFDGNFVYIDEHAYEFLSKSKLYGGEIIISNVGANVGTVFRCPYLPCKMSLAPNSIMVKFNESDEFYYYWLRSPFGQHMLKSIVTGSAQPKFNKTNFRDMVAPVPLRNVQDKIAEILRSLDDKIKVNNEINKNLEQQAQAIYAHMIIDEADESWPSGLLSDIATITMGQSPKGDTYNEDGTGTVFFQGRAEFGFRFPTRRLYTTDPKRMAHTNDVLMSVRAPVGDFNVAYGDCCIGRGLGAIHSKDNHQSFVLYTMFALRDQLDVFNGEGTVFGSINRDALNSMPISIPPRGVVDKFEAIVSPMDAAIRNNYEENCRLQTMRDSMLPRLMSGELDISDIDL
ncbi:MAG: restriction endonuclease subunit S [Prevotella sp.]|jgi:type I restriction enzyme S subunit|nr:restriction endonuclease subunit S [Prevotella sp.]